MSYYVYILTNKPDGVLYIGFTNYLERRIKEHKTKQVKGFTYKYNLSKLVYFEEFENSFEAFQRERQMKKWKRQWKLNLINEMNPEWKDLSKDWYTD
ncbi:GIY-YIG nuclease family protein [uncultured Sunxiuqinia sp.]|uniref:GIY-YIG nuclease family protein n=1 Tax=uncultured Sunxiuqinia sp. TaxID=1573825 RepID=UPI002AA6E0F9|nr:GIY-YIG nuclease family protein [uncultured Sunxiuqinia sp.]